MAKLVYTDPSDREITEPLGPESPVVTIGRARDCTIRSNRKSVSRRHARFEYNDGNYQVVDLDSSNGTYIIVDNRRKPVDNPEMLTHRDEIWCGDFILYFVDEEMEGSVSTGGGVQSNMGAGSQPADPPPVSGNIGGGPASGEEPAPPPPQAGSGSSAPVSGDVQMPGAESDGGVSVGNNAQSVTGPPSAEISGGVSAGIGAAESVPMDDGDEIKRLRDQKESIQALADRQSRRVDELEQQLEQTRAELEQAQAGSDDSDKLKELQQEIENRDRDLEILERELEREVDAGQRLQNSLDEYEQRIDELENERNSLEQQLQQLRSERDELKESAGADAEQHQQRIQQLEQQLQQARSAADSPAGGSDAELQELAELARQLDRTVDAIARTDLSPLSTVDRVRLESAIRDTEPRQTLHRMLEIAGADDG